MKTRSKSGFTLVEILIVVVILGILAAIVIPQFSQASTEARESSVKSNLQMLRSQIELYKIQHLEALPTVANLVTQMTTVTDLNGGDWATTGIGSALGPYMRVVPNNPYTAGSTVGADNTFDWVYDAATGDFTAGADTTADSAAHQAL